MIEMYTCVIELNTSGVSFEVVVLNLL